MHHREASDWVHHFGARHHGIVCAQAARTAGLTRNALRHRVASGELELLASGVYRLPGQPDTWESRLWAALIEAGPGAVVGLRSAGRLHQLWRYREATQIEVVKKRGSSHKALLGRLQETSLLDPDHVVEVDGFPCTSLPRTIFDLLGDPDHRPLRSKVAREWHEERMMAVVNDAMRYHGLTVLVELVVLGAIGRRGRPGTALVRKIFEELGEGYVPDASQVETVFSALLTRCDLPAPTKQLRIEDRDGLVGIVDFAWPELLLVVEIDSSFHDGPLDKRADERRDQRLRALGYEVVRLRWPDLVVGQEGVLRRLRAAAARRNLR